MNSAFLIWDRTDWDSECFDMDGSDEAVAFVWSEGYRWLAEVDGCQLNEQFVTRRDAEQAAEAILEQEIE